MVLDEKYGIEIVHAVVWKRMKHAKNNHEVAHLWSCLIYCGNPLCSELDYM